MSMVTNAYNIIIDCDVVEPGYDIGVVAGINDTDKFVFKCEWRI